MKKVLFIVLLFLVSLFFVLPSFANVTDSIYYEGVLFEIDEDQNANFEFISDLVNRRLYMIPSDSELQYTANGITYYRSDVSDIFDLYFAPNTTDGSYYENIGFDILCDDSGTTPFTDIFTHLVFENTSGAKYYFDLDILSSFSEQTIQIDFEYNYIIDGGELSDYFTTDFEVNGTSYFTEAESLIGMTTFTIYLENNSVTENNYYYASYRAFWVGYETESTSIYTDNYLLHYFVDNIAPYYNNNTDIEDALDDYIDYWTNTGLTITLPTNYEVGLFIPSWYDDGIDPWFEIYEEVTTINFTITNLSYDGSINKNEINYGISELWGDEIVYLIDGVDDYTLWFDSEYNYQDQPRFGFYISTAYNLVTFNTTGGSSVSSQFIAYGSSPQTPTAPTRNGYVFKGWNGVAIPDLEYDNYSIYYMSLSSFSITQATVFYAVWKPVSIEIYFQANGGIRKTHDGFISNVIYTAYNDTAENNYIGLDLDDSYFKLGYAFLGWYQDEALTIPFNESTPLTDNITIYAKWTASAVGEESPSALNNFLDELGLLNFPSLFFIYLVIIVLFTFIGLNYGFPSIIYVIFSILVSSVWWFFGWFNTVATLIILLTTILALVWISKEVS